MIDTEVMRLRRLRNKALRARALAVAMDLKSPRANSVYARGAVTCWRIARVVTGRLRGHPYVNYQRGPRTIRAIYDAMAGTLCAAVARHRGRALKTYAHELRRTAAALDDARALTWSADLSDAFGRNQGELRRLIEEVEAGTRQDSGAVTPAVRTEGHAGVGRSLAGNWPYLAF